MNTARRTAGAAGLLLVPLLAVAACGGPGGAPPGDTPPPGEPTPPGSGEAAVTVRESTAPPGGQVTVQASGFAPETAVQIGLGQPRSEYEVVRETRTDAEGRLDTTLQVPEWTHRGEPYVVVVTEPDHDPRETSDPFVVGAPGDAISVHGELTAEGVECPALRGPFGTLYTLAVSDVEHGPGTQVRVEGTIAGAATCQQGTVIDVESIRAH